MPPNIWSSQEIDSSFFRWLKEFESNLDAYRWTVNNLITNGYVLEYPLNIHVPKEETLIFHTFCESSEASLIRTSFIRIIHLSRHMIGNQLE